MVIVQLKAPKLQSCAFRATSLISPEKNEQPPTAHATAVSAPGNLIRKVSYRIYAFQFIMSL